MATATLRRQVTSIIAKQTAAQGGRTLVSSRELVAMREEITHASQLRSSQGEWADPTAVANAIHQVLRHVNETTQGARSLPVLGGAYFPNVTFAAGVAQSFAHGLQSIVSFIPGRMRQSVAGAAPVLVEVGQDGNRISLAASAACICDVWIYPQPGPAQNAQGSVPPFVVPTPGGVTITSTQFLANGTFSPTASGYYALLGCGGGGGGGGGAGGTNALNRGSGGGGGGGAQLRIYLGKFTAGNNYAVLIGGGGTPGLSGNSGAVGGAGGNGANTDIATDGPTVTWIGASGGTGGSHSGDGTPAGMGVGGAPNSNSVLLPFAGLNVQTYQPPGFGGTSSIPGNAASAGSNSDEGGAFTGWGGTGGTAGSSPNGFGGGGGGGGAFGNATNGGNGGAAAANGSAAASGPAANTGAGGGGGGGGGGTATTSGGAGAAGGSGQLTVIGPL